ncbi:MAG: DUF6155 family protein [Pseudomonadota bacterium]
MASKASLTALKKQLRKKTKEELIEEIAHLYKSFTNVKEFYQSSFFEDDTAVLKKYKKIVWDEFSPNGRYDFPKLRLSVARKAVSDYKKVSTSATGLADLMLTYVEADVDCTNTFGDIDEPFYNSMESMYASALMHILKENLFYEFEDRLKSVVRNTYNIGWGFHDGLSELYEEYRDQIDGN